MRLHKINESIFLINGISQKNVKVRNINTSFYFNYKSFQNYIITRYHKRDIVFLRNMKMHTKFHLHTHQQMKNKKPI